MSTGTGDRSGRIDWTRAAARRRTSALCISSVCVPKKFTASSLNIPLSGSTGTPAESYLAVKRRNFLLQAHREQLLESRKPSHPKIREVEEEIRQNKKLLEVYRTQSLEQLESKRE